MQLEAAIQELVASTKSVDESLEQVVILPELYRLLKQYSHQQQTQHLSEKPKILESIRFKINDCLIRYKENLPLVNALKQLEIILK